MQLRVGQRSRQNGRTYYLPRMGPTVVRTSLRHGHLRDTLIETGGRLKVHADLSLCTRVATMHLRVDRFLFSNLFCRFFFFNVHAMFRVDVSSSGKCRGNGVPPMSGKDDQTIPCYGFEKSTKKRQIGKKIKLLRFQ